MSGLEELVVILL